MAIPTLLLVPDERARTEIERVAGYDVQVAVTASEIRGKRFQRVILFPARIGCTNYEQRRYDDAVKVALTRLDEGGMLVRL